MAQRPRTDPTTAGDAAAPTAEPSSPPVTPHRATAPRAGQTDRGWPWRPFVNLALASALIPGFLLGGLLPAASWWGWTWGIAYPALAQAHGHAQLVGWGGALILGVALQFLPRLRGSTLVQPQQVPRWFVLLAGGLGLRLVGQVVAALAAATFAGPPAAGGPADGSVGAGAPGALSGAAVALTRGGLVAMAAGAVLEVVAAAGLLGLLARTLRAGPPLGQKKAFGQVVPLLVVSGASLLAALVLWTLASLGTVLGFEPGTGSAVLPGPVDAAALRLALFGFVGTISVAMSSRVFSLFYRVKPARVPLLTAAAVPLALGLLLDAAAGIMGLATGGSASTLVAVADLAWSCGLTVGTVAVRVFEGRLTFPGDNGRYRLWRDPAAVAALLAYVWAAIASLLLLLRGLRGLGLALTPMAPPADSALHATGAGFMTLLIVAVAPTMLPGFGGGRLRGHGWVWVAVVLAALAALLRVLPGLVQAFSGRAVTWSQPALAVAGAAGLAAVVAVTLALRTSWRVPRTKLGRP